MGDFTTAGEVESVTAHEVINKNGMPPYRTGAHMGQYKAEKKAWLYRTGSMAGQNKAQMQVQIHGADREKSRKSGSP